MDTKSQNLGDRKSLHVEVGPQPPQMRSWRTKLLTLRRSQTEPPMPKQKAVIKKSDDHVEKCVKRSVSMKTMRDVVRPLEREAGVVKKESEPLSQPGTREKTSPAYSIDDLSEDESGDTPRSGVRVSLEKHKDFECNEDPADPDDTDVSSGDEECTGFKDAHQKNLSHPSVNKRKSATVSVTYQEFVIRPLVVDDYGPMLLRFLSWFDPMKTKALTHPKFAGVLFERKRKRHYTLVAVSSETGRFIAMGSMIIVDNIFGPNHATGIVDALLVHPDYQSTPLFDKVLIRLKEVAEMIPGVKGVRVNVEGRSGTEVLGSAKSCTNLGCAYEMNLENGVAFK